MAQEKIFTHCVRTLGDFQCSYHFESKDAMQSWLKTEFPLLKDEYENLTYKLQELDGLKVGDFCHVLGEGLDTFTITELFSYSPNRYGFLLDSCQSEEVDKCYKL